MDQTLISAEVSRGTKIPGASEDDSQLEPVALTSPFKKIALALSGGGFRAASFSIGTMSYLAQVRNCTIASDKGSLLDNVQFISSASGGTFAGILYAARAKKGMPFPAIYHELVDFMQGQSLLQNVLEIINDESQWDNSGKNRNFINAFAKIYDRKLFKGEKFGVFSEDEPTEVKRDIEVCFNATEFYRGLSFRFQTKGNTGNRYIFFDKKTQSGRLVLKNIRLGDIMASSSCFPAGFEPIVYPEDFSYGAADGDKGLQTDELRRAMVMTDYDGKEEVLEGSFGLMDGGVDDNQGVYSAMLADKRRRRVDSADGFDLIMVTDVASYFMDAYKPDAGSAAKYPKAKNLGGILKDLYGIYQSISRSIRWAAIVSAIVLIASIFMIVFSKEGKWMNFGYLLLSPSILSLLLVAFIGGYRAGNQSIKKLADWLGSSDNTIVAKIKAGIPSVSGFSDESVKLLLKFLKQSPLTVLDQMVKNRVTSLLSIVLDINLKQTRRLIFDIFYGSFYGKDIWQNRRVFNVIYELSSFNKVSRAMTLRRQFDAPLYNADPHDNWSANCQKLLTENCLEINSIAESARTMGTTLWYDEKEVARMRDIIACGQFTACCKLLEYALITARMIEIEANLPADKKMIRFAEPEMTLFLQVKKTLEEDWKKFKADPFYLYKEMDELRPKK